MNPRGEPVESDAGRGVQAASAPRSVAIPARPHASRGRPPLAPLERSVRRWSSGFILPSAALFGGLGAWAWDKDKTVAWFLFGLAGALLVSFLGAPRFPKTALGFVFLLHLVVAPLWIGVAYPFGVVGTGLFPYLAYRGFHAAHELHWARRRARGEAGRSES